MPPPRASLGRPLRLGLTGRATSPVPLRFTGEEGLQRRRGSLICATKGDATISFTNTVNIDRPITEVFTYLSDLEHTPEWNWAITETKKVTPGPVSVGTRYLQTRSVPQTATEHLEVTSLEPNRRIEIRGTLAALPAHLTYQLDQEGNGTRLTNTIELEPQGAIRLAGALVGGRIKQAVADNLDELKARLESS